ncbi:hypothetical protein BDN72DRAFT_847144 [Pluteus cervinus]|uniref:Uncharacterized protein n=1 Tax=Pluteus cervinus TaxID=181527 RepID=A0ACD3AE10_9AGAR|nr:hypothetical protein BDN72DRAFT_847144 [Pluteus cervinus]
MGNPQYPLDAKSASKGDVAQVQPTGIHEPRRRLGRRFSFSLITLSLGFWFALTHLRNIYTPIRPLDILQEDAPTSLPDDVFVKDCASWFYSESPEHDYVAHTSLQLPIDSPHLFFASQGSILGGTFHLVPSDHVSPYLDVHISTVAKHPQVIDLLKVCSLGKEGGGLGIGLLAPHSVKWQGYERVDVVVRIPKSPNGEMLHINSFETNLPFINHEVGDLSNVVVFNKLRLGGAFSGVNVKSIAAVQAIVKVTHAPIVGSFNASDSLSLVTSSGPVSVTVNLFNDPETGRNTSLAIWTGAGPIDGTVNLFSHHHEGELQSQAHALFNVSAYTSFSPLHLRFPTIAPNSVLTLVSQTAVGPHRVELHEAYEGTFSVSTGIFETVDVKIREGEDVEDPEGRGRKRFVEFEKIALGSAKGKVWWGDDEVLDSPDTSDDGEGDDDQEPVGSVEIKTGHGRAVLWL